MDGSRELTRVGGWACVVVWARGWQTKPFGQPE